MPQHFSVLCPVLDPSSLPPHCIPAAWRVGGQFLNADKDFPMAQDSLRDDLSFFHYLEMVMRKQEPKKSLGQSSFSLDYLASSHLCQEGQGWGEFIFHPPVCCNIFLESPT